jgi:hypothetical protein
LTSEIVENGACDLKRHGRPGARRQRRQVRAKDMKKRYIITTVSATTLEPSNSLTLLRGLRFVAASKIAFARDKFATRAIV